MHAADTSEAAPGRHLTLGLIGAMAVVTFVQRQSFSVLMQPIKEDLGFSDSVLALLSGVAFAVFYSLTVFPIARLADRGDRARLIGIGLALLGLATAACGLAQSAFHLALARLGVATGNATVGPAGQALLVSIFPISQRVRVIGFLQACYAVGIAGSVAITGWLAAAFDWRTVFFLIGLPGLLLALAIALFASEPRRTANKDEPAPPAMPFGEMVQVMAASAPLRWILALCIAAAMTGFGILMWAPAFLQRVHGLGMADTGSLLGGATLVGLVAGHFTAGWLGDRFGAERPGVNGMIAAAGLALGFPFALGFVLAPGIDVAIGCFLVMQYLVSLWVAPSIALAFAQVPAQMRATLSATLGTTINLAGVGLGTLVVGAMSDLFEAGGGENPLRQSLMWISTGLLVAAFAAYKAARAATRQRAEGAALQG